MLWKEVGRQEAGGYVIQDLGRKVFWDSMGGGDYDIDGIGFIKLLGIMKGRIVSIGL